MKNIYHEVEMKRRILSILVVATLFQIVVGKQCQNLLVGQYKCNDPEIDIELQAEKGCHKNYTLLVPCFPVKGVVCNGREYNGDEVGFYKEMPCRYVTGKSFETALYLSIFLGCFGIDRFYLGYPAIGLLKFCTLGFFMIFQLIDIILIATQVLKPADGSEYVIDYYGARVHRIVADNNTLLYPQNFN